MLWKPEEDDLLRALKNREDPGFKLIIKLKSLESVKKRVKYLKLELPF